jgi:hypothetical protein
MGQDLISAGWTIDTERTNDVVGVAAFLADISMDDLLANIEALDPSGGLDMSDYNEVVANELRDELLSGAEVVLDGGNRMSAVWDIPETSLAFVITGGGSWGDDPFEGFSSLVMFLAALTIWPELKTMTNVVCEGLPSRDALISWLRVT